MKVGSLTSISKVISRISNPNALAALHRSVQIEDNIVRCCSDFGNVFIAIEPTGLKNPVLLNCESFLTIISSLPKEADIKFIEEAHRIKWECGVEKGHLNYVQTDDKIPDISHDSFPWNPPKEIGRAFALAGSACESAAVSIGLFGISVHPNGNKLQFISSNSTSLAATSIPLGDYPGKNITIRPPIQKVIETLIDYNQAPCQFDVVSNGGKTDGIYVLGNNFAAELPLGQPLDHDLKEWVEKFPPTKEVSNINSDQIKRFVARARNLSEKNSDFKIVIKIDAGRLTLTHEAIASSTEQWTLVDGLDKSVKYDPVELQGTPMLDPLENAISADFGYLKDKQLVLRGENPEFMYVVGGQN